MPNSPADGINWLIAFSPLAVTMGVWFFTIGTWMNFFQHRW
jgi:hypothetical protein